MTLEADKGNATYITLLAIVMSVIAGSIFIALFPPLVPGKMALLVVANDDGIRVEEQPILGSLGGGMLVRAPPGNVTAVLTITDGGLEFYRTISSPPYSSLLPHPVLVESEGIARIEGLSPGECSFEGFKEESSINIKTNIVIALAYSELDSTMIRITPSGNGEPTINLSLPFTIRGSSFEGFRLTTPLEIGKSLTATSEPAGGMLVYIPVETILVSGSLTFNCDGDSLEIEITTLIPEESPGSPRVKYLEKDYQLGQGYFLPMGTYECGLISTNKFSPGDVVYTSSFTENELNYTATGSVDNTILGINVDLDSIIARVSIIAGEEGYRSVCVLRSISGDLLPLVSSSPYRVGSS